MVLHADFASTPITGDDSSCPDLSEVISHIGAAIVEEFFDTENRQEISWVQLLQGFHKCSQVAGGNGLKHLFSVYSQATQIAKGPSRSKVVEKVPVDSGTSFDTVAYLTGVQLRDFLWLCWLLMCSSRLPRNIKASKLQAFLPKIDSLLSGATSVCDRNQVVAGFYDQCNLRTNPGWPLRNLLALAVVRCGLTELQVLAYRQKRGQIDLELCLVIDIELPNLTDWRSPDLIPEAVGWERTVRGRLSPRIVHLASTMDPHRLATSAADLNLKLMRWRLLPSLNVPLLSSTKCLLLAAGTLGCQVARGLMGWGVRRVTFVDSGKVAMSNPVRQSLLMAEN